MSPASKKDGSASATAPTTPTSLTDKQTTLLAIIMRNIQGKPDINWVNVATQSGLKNERVAKETYRQMTKKFGWGAGSPSGPGGGSASHTPTKVQKRTGKVGTKSAKKASAKEAKEEGEEEENNKNDESGEDGCV